MKIRFSSHALKRIEERGIGKRVVYEAIESPDKMEASGVNKSRLLIKKIYSHPILKKDHLLLIVCEKLGGTLEVVTVIDTSKISKHF